MMANETKVWLSSKKLANGKRSYYLRWIDRTEGWKSKRIDIDGKPCTDKRRADAERLNHEEQLRAGTYRHLKHITWAAFVEDIAANIPGVSHRIKAQYALNLFGASFTGDPADVTYPHLRDFAKRLREKKLKGASINGVFRYLRLAFNEGVELHHLRANPMPRRWKWEPVDKRPIREVTPAEEVALKRAAGDLYGTRWRSFVAVALGTGARRGELLALSWDDVDLDRAIVTIPKSKTHRPRRIPVNPATVRALRRLLRNIEAVRLDGPFKGMDDNLSRQWGRIRKSVGLAGVQLHDLRRTYISRLIRAGVPLPTVSKLSGNSIAVIMEYYNAVGTDDDKREAVARLA